MVIIIVIIMVIMVKIRKLDTGDWGVSGYVMNASHTLHWLVIRVSAMMSSIGYFNLSGVITFAGLCSTLGRRDRPA